MVLKILFQHGVIKMKYCMFLLLEWKNKLTELVNNKITTLKVQNNSKLFKGNFFTQNNFFKN